MPQITSRICGVCPTAHHMAATKALDDLYKVTPAPAGRKIRELVYSTFMVEDHSLHFYFLGGPDFVVGPTAPAAERNVLGVIAKVGVDVGKKVIAMRRRLRELTSLAAGKAGHPVFGCPAESPSASPRPTRSASRRRSPRPSSFAQFTLQVFDDIVLKNSDYVKLILADFFTHHTYYMGLVDARTRSTSTTACCASSRPRARRRQVRAQQVPGLHRRARRAVELHEVLLPEDSGWQASRWRPEWRYSVAPLARLNVADRMATPLAQQAYEKYIATLGKPVHHTLANHGRA